MKLFFTFFLLVAERATAQAANFTVNTTADTVDVAPGDGVCADGGGACSLRAAISETNQLGGADTIALPAGVYSQTLVAADEDSNAGGDFDIRGDLTVNGAGRGVSFVQAGDAPGAAAERVFHNLLFATTVTLSNMTVRHGVTTTSTGSGAYGGGINNRGTMTLDGVEVTGNLGTDVGGGIVSFGGAFTLNNSFVTGNLCDSWHSCGGGGMANLSGVLTINNTVFFSNTSRAGSGEYNLSYGGGLTATGSRVTITRSVFSNNDSSGGRSLGSGLRLDSIDVGGPMTIEITDTTVTDNTSSSTGTLNRGGGIAFNPTPPSGSLPAAPILATLTNVTVDNNSGGINGAGISAGSNAPNVAGITLNLNNCTVSGNTASGSGGGILVVGTTSVVNVSNSTVAGNTAGTGGGINVSEGTLNIRSSIVGDNTGGGAPDISGAIVSGNYNLFESIAGATVTGTTTENIIGFDPQLAALAENGGSTRTRALMPTSPAIDKGNSFGIMIDQRGSPRPIDNTSFPNAAGGDGADIGSFEAQNAAATFVTVSGKVMTPSGKALSRTTVVMTDMQGGARTVSTDRRGNFVFREVRAGETYVFEVRSKLYRFNPQTVTIAEDLGGLNFTAQ